MPTFAAVAGKPSPPRLRRVSVEGLFGLFDHTFGLNLEDRVTILHGPNGVGKTSLLRLISAVYEGGGATFACINFKALHLELSEGTTFTIEKVEPQLHHASVSFPPATGQERSSVATDELRALLSQGSVVEVRKKVLAGRCRLVEAERLLRLQRADDGPEAVANREPTYWSHSAVGKLAEQLANRVEEAKAAYGVKSQQLDQSFPERLLQKQPGLTLALDQLVARMQDLDSRRAELQRVGLLGDNGGHTFDTSQLASIEPAQQQVLSLYVRDTAEKLEVLERFAKRVALLLRAANGKFRHKEIRIHPEEGLQAFGAQGSPIPLERLSSGEQHELVLLCELLFESAPNTLILIDEPELSQHLVWQKRFMDDLLEIARLAELDVLVSTHSPFIVGDRSDLMVELSDELPGEKRVALESEDSR